MSSVPDGLMMALVLVAYDLYVLRDHGQLQEEGSWLGVRDGIRNWLVTAA